MRRMNEEEWHAFVMDGTRTAKVATARECVARNGTARGCHDLVRHRRANLGDDLISVLSTCEVEGERLSELEIDLFFMLLTVAGNETTRNLTANGMHALFQHPDQLAKLRVTAANSLVRPTLVGRLRNAAR